MFAEGLAAPSDPADPLFLSGNELGLSVGPALAGERSWTFRPRSAVGSLPVVGREDGARA
jgi:hypothetical protein